MQWYNKLKEGKLYNPILLTFNDASDKFLFRTSRYTQTLYAWMLYCILDGGFAIYLIYLTFINSRDWRLTPDEYNTFKDEEKRLLVLFCSFIQYFVTGLILFLGRRRNTRLFDLIVHIFIV